MFDQLSVALDQGVVYAAVEEIIAAVGDPATRKLLHDTAEYERRQFLAIVAEVLDDDDQAMLVAARYIEQKAHWIQLNTALGYKMMFKGELDSALNARASIFSFLLGRIEPLLPPAAVGRINHLLAEPVPDIVPG